MKRVLIVCIVILILLGCCLAFGGHEQRLSRYTEAPVQQATFEELLSAPYTTEGAWEFHDVFSLYHDKAAWSESDATEVTGVRIFTLDNTCCYSVVSYQTEPEPDTTHYVFTSDDPQLLESLSDLICNFLENK